MNFFCDANVSWRIAKMLAALHEGNHKIIHITQHEYFLQNNNQHGNDTPDIEIIKKLSEDKPRWAIISGDCDIVDTAHERAALLQSGLTFFALDHYWMKSKVLEQAWKITKVWDEIERYAKEPEPALYIVHMGKKLYVETIKISMRARGGKYRG